MRLVFMGNGPFAAPALRTLVAARPAEVIAVIARPDLPQGKHQRIEPGPVARAAAELSLPLLQPPDVNERAFQELLAGYAADLLVVADFGQILSPECLACARLGGINIHGSLLPKYRGAAPVAWAIFHGETETGVSIIQITGRVDAGGVLAQRAVPIGPDQTAGELEAILAAVGAELVVEAITAVEKGTALPLPQDPKLATRAPKLKKTNGLVDWRRSAVQVHNQVRAMLPWPIAYTYWERRAGAAVRLQILQSAPLAGVRDAGAAPGTIVKASPPDLWVQAGFGLLAIRSLRPEGKAALSADAFLRGSRMQTGDWLGPSASETASAPVP